MLIVVGKGADALLHLWAQGRMELYPLLSLEVHVILKGDVQCISPHLLKDGILRLRLSVCTWT